MNKTLIRRIRQLGNGIAAALLAALGFQGWCAWEVYKFSRPAAAEVSGEAALVLGAAAWGDKPSPVLRERINHALALYQTGAVQSLIFTGGTPKPGYASEAEVARRFAIKQGVDPQDIYYETASRDTYHNLVNSRLIMSRHQIDSVVIVSDPYHIARALAMAEDLGIKAAYSATPTSRFTAASYAARGKFFIQESNALFLYYILSALKKTRDRLAAVF